MKVLFCVRHNFYQLRGGAFFQILKTKEYLEKLGVKCDLTTSPYDVNFDKYDLVHLTDLTWVFDNLIYLEKLQKSSVKKVMSTIYWPFDDYAANGAPFFQKILFKIFGINGYEFFKALGKFLIRKKAIYLKGLFSNYINNQINIISQIDWLLPNASSEMKVLNDRLGLDLNNFNIVYNSIDIKLYDTITKHNKIKKDNNIITFPARIDQRKNQLNFLKSMIDTDYEIRFIGSPGKNSNSYYTKLKKIAKLRGNVKFISEISQEELFKHMLEAKVNVLTSWVETPGLVSLEAAYAGCNLVVSDKGSVRDYFKNFAFYCNPANIENIKKQTIRAMNSDFNEGFRTLIREEYSYSKAAQDTLDVYKKIL